MRRASPSARATRPSAASTSPVGGGWLAQAERLLADEPESAIHAWPLVFHSLDALMADAASTKASRSPDRRWTSPAARATPTRSTMAMSFKRHGARLQAATGRTGSPSSTRRRRPRRPASSICAPRATSTATRSRACRSVGDLGAGGPVGRRGRALDAPPVASAATRASAGSIGPRSRCSAATGPRRSRRRARPCEELERYRLLDARRLRPLPDRRGPAADGRPRRRPRRRSTGRTSTGTTPSPGLRSCSSRGARSRTRGGRIDRALVAAAGHGWRGRPHDAGSAAARAGRHRPRGARPGRRPGGRRGAGVDRHRLRPAAVPGRRA